MAKLIQLYNEQPMTFAGVIIALVVALVLFNWSWLRYWLKPVPSPLETRARDTSQAVAALVTLADGDKNVALMSAEFKAALTTTKLHAELLQRWLDEHH